MADQLDSLHLPDFGLGPEYHYFAFQGDAEAIAQLEELEELEQLEQLDQGDRTPMATSGFQTVSEVSGSGIGTHNGTNGDSGTSDPSKLPGTTNSSMKRPRDYQSVHNSITKRPGPTTMTGRFCGRLPTKDDEKRLVKECTLIGQYLHKDSTRMNTMATIIRGIASGRVRAHLEERAKECRELRSMLERMRSQIEMIERQSDRHANTVNLSGTITQLREELGLVRQELSAEREQNALHERRKADHALSEPHSALGTESGGSEQAIIKQSLNTLTTLPGGANAQTGTSLMGMIKTVAQAIPTLDPGLHTPDANSLLIGSPVQLDQAQPILSSLGSEVAIPTLEETAKFVCHLVGNAPDPQTSEPVDSLVSDAQQFVRAAALHLVAKNEAASQAHLLTAEARKHSNASIKAADLAKDLRKTLSEMTRQELNSSKAVEAQKTVENLELRAQMHASMTTQAVAKAKNMMGIVQNHDREQAIATATANALHKKATTASSGPQSPGRSQHTDPGCCMDQPPRHLTLRELMSAMNNSVTGKVQPACPALPPMTTTVTSTVATPDSASVLSMAGGNVGADGLPNMALNLRNVPPPPSAPLPLLDYSISYMHEMDPSIEATAFQEQIACMHAEQPDALVRAEPIQITDAEFDALNLATSKSILSDIPLLEDIPDIRDVIPGVDSILQ